MIGKKVLLTGFFVGLFVACAASGANTDRNAPINFSDIKSPIVLRGDSKTAYRDPAALYHAGKFYLFYTLVRTEEDGRIYSYTAVSTSHNLQDWSGPRIITPKGQHLNFSSPGNVVRFADVWILCLQTYPRLNYRRGEKLRWADGSARLFIMRSKDLLRWSEPELLRVKGPDVKVQEMGRMIDPYLIADKDEPGKWWCFYKQRGVSLSWSYDLVNWTYFGRADSGENVCVLVDEDEYVLFHSPDNGIGVKRSKDLKQWRDVNGLMTLGQQQWPWAENRITAGVVLDLRKEARVGKYLMFFHGGGPGKNRTQDNVDANCSLGIAWSDDLEDWNWPGKVLQKSTAAEPKNIIVNSVGMRLKYIKPGEFLMGSSGNEKGQEDDELPQHPVKLTRGFYMGVTEVTQAQWVKVMESSPWLRVNKEYVRTGDDYPAVNINWNDAVEFCKKLRQKEGRKYRLPTEAEWEYACRAGTKTAYSFGDDDSKLGDYGWFRGNAYDAGEKYAHIAGQKKPNPWGLYDMHGNVWEWCSDWSGDYAAAAVTDPTGPSSGTNRVLRSGSGGYIAGDSRSAERGGSTPDSRTPSIGFRVVVPDFQ